MIRKATLNDFKEINSIFNEVHRLHVNNLPNIFKDKDPLPKEDFVKMLEDNSQIILVNEDDEINGFIRIEILEKEGILTKKRKDVNIEQIAVKEGQQKQGIGKKLIEAAIEIFKKENGDNLILDVWSFNQNAIDFYKHIGFKEMKIKMKFETEE